MKQGPMNGLCPKRWKQRRKTHSKSYVVPWEVSWQEERPIQEAESIRGEFSPAFWEHLTQMGSSNEQQLSSIHLNTLKSDSLTQCQSSHTQVTTQAFVHEWTWWLTSTQGTTHSNQRPIREAYSPTRFICKNKVRKRVRIKLEPFLRKNS